MVNSTISYFVQWKQAQSGVCVALFPTMMEGDGASKWVKPQTNAIKVSVDAIHR